jgi:hypothetical protein
MRRGLVWTLVVLLVLATGGYFGDNLLRSYAQDRAVEAVGTYVGDGRATVQLGGTPFFLALITRSVPNAHVEVATLPLEITGHKVHLTDVVADTGTVALGASEVSVATMTASATLSYADLSTIADVPITYAKDGRLQLRYTKVVLGRQLSFAVSALPKLDAQAQVVRLTDPKLDLAGNNVDLGLTQDQLDSIVEPIKVQLDHNLRLTSISPTDGGVALGVAGTNVSVPVP